MESSKIYKEELTVQKIPFEKAKKIIEQMDKYICNIRIENALFTGFFCKIPINDKNKMLPMLITYDFMEDKISKNGQKIMIKINEEKDMKSIDLDNRIKYHSKEYHTVMIEIKETDNIKNYLELDNIIIQEIFKTNNKKFQYLKETIYVIQYSLELSVSFGTLNNIKENEKHQFEYSCFTSSGSSGSPILNINSNKLIGIHIFRDIKNNSGNGIFLDYPIREFIKINYNNKESKRDANIIINNVMNEKLFYEFKTKYSLDIQDNIGKIDLIKKNIENEGFQELTKLDFNQLEELNLSNNKIKNIDNIEKMNCQKLEILNLSYNHISDINMLNKAQFYNLKKLIFHQNNIYQIGVLEKVKFAKLEFLDLSSNKISDINFLQKVNFEELKYLNFFDNSITNIDVLEKVIFEKLEYLNLGANEISDINILQKVKFNELSILYLHINNITNIDVFEKVNFKKLKELNLCENNINEKHNNKIILKLRNTIKKFVIDLEKNVYTPPMSIGIIFNVSKDILSKLIRFDKIKSFFENFCKEYNGEIIALINGNEELPYYDINILILSAINYLSDKNTIFLKNQNINRVNKILFDEICLVEIFERLRNQENMSELIDSKIVYNNILILKDIILKSYSLFLSNFFELFEHLINKPSLVDLPLKKIFKAFDKNYSDSKYIIIISDGNLKENSEEINNFIDEARKKKIIIVTFFLSQKMNIDKKIYNDFPSHLDSKLKYLFNISSKVDYKNPFARYYIKQGWNFPQDGIGTLFLEVNLDFLNNADSFVKDIEKIRYEGINIKLLDLNYDNLIQYKYQFFTKNQIFGTCWANAYSAGIFLTNKRILGKNIKSFEEYRENLIKLCCKVNVDGGGITDQKVQEYFQRERLHFKNITKEKAITSLQKGRLVIYSFRLSDQQWDNFDKFYKNNKTGILTEKILNNGCQYSEENTGHAVLLIEKTKNYFRLLNSWGSNWADAGTFKIEDADILKPFNTTNEKPRFFDIFFYENELNEEEKNYYIKNNEYIRSLISIYSDMSINNIRKHMNHLYHYSFSCEICKERMVLDKLVKYIRDGLYYIKCPFCQSLTVAKNKLKELLIFENLMNDGNKDFDINFKENYYIQIDRVEFYNNSETTNRSDKCTIGSKNVLEHKIDPFLNKKINSIISLDNGKFAVCASNVIIIFEIKKTKINYLIVRNIENDNILALCNLKISNLIAVGGENLKIYQINYQRNELNLELKYLNNKTINKIIMIKERITQRFAVCDKNGNISLYTIHKNNNNISIRFDFIKRCHKYSINYILCLQDENILVSSSNEDRMIKFWEIQENNLLEIKNLRIISKVFTFCLLYINKTLLIGTEEGIKLYHYNNRVITFLLLYKDVNFGRVYPMEYLGNNYFICGRSLGFCSLLLLRAEREEIKGIRKINVFRNNNEVISDNWLNAQNDHYYINNICIQKTSEATGYILISSIDNTLKVYSYSYFGNTFIE